MVLTIHSGSCVIYVNIGPILNLPHWWLVVFLMQKIVLVHCTLMKRSKSKILIIIIPWSWDHGFMVDGLQEQVDGMVKPLKYSAILIPTRIPVFGIRKMLNFHFSRVY